MTAADAALRPPILCLVTDRCRLVADASERTGIAPEIERGIEREAEREIERRRADALIRQIEEAAEAGIDLVQIREPDLPAALLLDLVTRAVAAVRHTRTRIVVNDRLDVALAGGAHGVHLRGTSVDARRVRARVEAIGRGVARFLVGRSVHSAEEAASVEAAGGLDYLILGTMFPTSSKPSGQRLAGPDVLRAAAQACRLPILAIGGVTLDNAAAAARAGAAGIAAIGLFLGDHAAGAAPGRPLRAVLDELRRTLAESPPPL